MIRSLLLVLLLSSPVLGQDPAPPVPERPQLTVGKDILGDGTRKNPYVFGTNTKCVIRLTGSGIESATWETSDAPTDFEVIGNVGIFSLSEPGNYVIYVRGDKWHTKAWFQVDAGQGPRPPPLVEDRIGQRVKTALAGHPDDAKAFAAMCDELAKALDAGTVPTLKGMEEKMGKALTAVGWPVGKYSDMTKLAGELWGAGVSDRELTAADRVTFAQQLRTISKACGEVK